jgi:hypothetical protein
MPLGVNMYTELGSVLGVQLPAPDTLATEGFLGGGIKNNIIYIEI